MNGLQPLCVFAWCTSQSWAKLQAVLQGCNGVQEPPRSDPLGPPQLGYLILLVALKVVPYALLQPRFPAQIRQRLKMSRDVAMDEGDQGRLSVTLCSVLTSKICIRTS